MPGGDDATDHKGQLPPFTSPKFNWNQDNLICTNNLKALREW